MRSHTVGSGDAIALFALVCLPERGCEKHPVGRHHATHGRGFVALTFDDCQWTFDFPHFRTKLPALYAWLTVDFVVHTLANLDTGFEDTRVAFLKEVG